MIPENTKCIQHQCISLATVKNVEYFKDGGKSVEYWCKKHAPVIAPLKERVMPSFEDIRARTIQQINRVMRSKPKGQRGRGPRTKTQA